MRYYTFKLLLFVVVLLMQTLPSAHQSWTFCTKVLQHRNHYFVLRKWEVPTLIRQANDLLSRQSLLLAGSYFLNIKSPKLFTGNSVHINHNNSPCPLPRVGKFSAATVRPYHQSQHPCKGLSNSIWKTMWRRRDLNAATFRLWAWRADHCSTPQYLRLQ